MELEYKDQESLRQYLLGSLPSGEIAAIEERLLTDSGFYEELLVVEDELIDQYLSGEQSAAERQKFENYFSVAPERQQKVRFARTLKKYLETTGDSEEIAVEPTLEEPASVDRRDDRGQKRERSFFPLLAGNPIVNYALAATLLLVIGFVSWLAWSRSRNQPPGGPGQVLAVTLTPGLSRSGGETTKVSIPPGTDTLQLRLELPSADYASYRAEVLTSARTNVSVIENLQPEFAAANKFITVPLPVALLKRDDYSVQLYGKRPDGINEDVASYIFRVLN